MNTAAARKRWRTEAGESRAQAVIERLAAGEDLRGLDLDRTDEGLIDLRGLSLPVARIVGRRELDGYLVEARENLRLTDVVLDAIDLSSAVLDNLWLTGAQVTNCRFDDVRRRRCRRRPRLGSTARGPSGTRGVRRAPAVGAH